MFVHASCLMSLPVSCLCMVVHAGFFHYEKSGDAVREEGPFLGTDLEFSVPTWNILLDIQFVIK